VYGEASPAEAGGLSRTAQIQPGVFFTFDAPFVRLLVFYSNTLEDPGVIADSNIGTAQIDFLKAALARVKQERFSGALLFAHHHPPASRRWHRYSVSHLRQWWPQCAKAPTQQRNPATHPAGISSKDGGR
jgi:hypothetical protein